MKPPMYAKVILVVMLSTGILACSKKTNDDIKEENKQKVYSLTAEERSLALANAKKFFEQEWINADGQRGQVTECKPTDSNKNNLASCFGLLPQPEGGFKEEKRYCGYVTEIVGCSKEDI